MNGTESMSETKSYRKYKYLNFLPHQRTWAEIDIRALEHNYKLLVEHIRKSSPDCKPMCVVKADAYSHSMGACVPALIDSGADFFAVSSLEEALAVKEIASQKGADVRVLILGYTLPSEAELLVEHGITQTVFSLEYAKELDAAISTGKKLSVHIKLDTGMNRLGFGTWDSEFDNTVNSITSLVALDHLSPCGIFTHFARADEKSAALTELQAQRYISMLDALQKRGITFSERHLCNSAASIENKEYHFDMVRLGIVLYGISPSDEVKLDGLIPVMRLKTIVSHIHTLSPGETVSYGGHFSSNRPITLATLPIGYADGFPRACTGGFVRVRDKDAKIVGNICMDQCMIDITDCKDVQVGDTVTVYADTPEYIENFARLASTIPYELVCLVSGRVPRIIIE